MQYLDSTVAKIEAMNTEWAEKMVKGLGAFEVDQVLAALFGILCQVDKTLLEQDLQDVKVRFVWGQGPEVIFGEHRYTVSLLCHFVWVRTRLEPADCYALLLGMWGYMPHCLPPESTRFHFSFENGEVVAESVRGLLVRDPLQVPE